MAILVNIGSRGFVLKEGFIGPAQQITVDDEIAEKLSKMYPQELKVVVAEKVEKKATEEKTAEVVEEKAEPKKTSRNKKK